MKLLNLALILALVLLMAVGGRFEVAFGPIPFILTDLFVFIGALWLSLKHFSLAILLFLLLGALGLPVFAGGESGFSHLIGPTSGYLFGYLFGGLLAGLLQRNSKSIIVRLLFVWLGYYLLFVLGISGLVLLGSMDFLEALQVGFIPFIFSMHLKGAMAFFIGEVLIRYRYQKRMKV